MIKEKIILALLILSVFCGVSRIYSQTETPPLPEQTEVQIEGRLSLEKHGQQDWLILLAKDAQTYFITGRLKDTLKNSLLELGQNNLVSVTGTKDGRSSLSCRHTRRYEPNENGEKELVNDARCIRYYYLEVTRIILAKQSSEKMPPPKREAGEEKRILTDESDKVLPPEYIMGKVKTVNLKSPVKSIVVTNLDQSSELKSITLLITANTRVLKNMGEKENPMDMDVNTLRPGQEVNVAYFKQEFSKEAIVIMIVK